MLFTFWKTKDVFFILLVRNPVVVFSQMKSLSISVTLKDCCVNKCNMM